MGGHGAVVAWSNVFPELFVRLYEAALDGDIRTAFELQKRICLLEKIFEIEGPATDGAFLSGVKAALEIAGICGRQVTAPFTKIPDKLMPEVERLMKQCQKEV
jgi:4-hydroxy-tetrahydrodipicolinate synthase